MKPSSRTILQGPSVELRAPFFLDAEQLLRLRVANRDDWRPYEQTRDDGWYTLEGQKRELRRAREDWGVRDCTFGVYPNEELVGVVGIFPVEDPTVVITANIGYMIDAHHRGSGYATEAARLLVSFGFKVLLVGRVRAGIVDDNAPSIRVVEKLRFHRGDIALGFMEIRGQLTDHRIWYLDYEEWRQND